MAGKRSRAATKGMRPSARITGSQRKARVLNIEKARAAKSRGKEGLKFRKTSAGSFGAEGMTKVTKKNIKGNEGQIRTLLKKGKSTRGTRGAANLLMKGIDKGIIKSMVIDRKGSFYFKTKKGEFDAGNLEVMAAGLRKSFK